MHHQRCRQRAIPIREGPTKQPTKQKAVRIDWQMERHRLDCENEGTQISYRLQIQYE